MRLALVYGALLGCMFLAAAALTDMIRGFVLYKIMMVEPTLPGHSLAFAKIISNTLTALFGFVLGVIISLKEKMRRKRSGNDS